MGILHGTSFMIFLSIRWRPASIRDFFAKRLKMQLVACYLWHRPLREVDAHTSLLSAAFNLFQQVGLHFFDLEILCFMYGSQSLNWLLLYECLQIIYAHEKSFDAGQFVEIKSLLSFFQKDKIPVCSLQSYWLMLPYEIFHITMLMDTLIVWCVIGCRLSLWAVPYKLRRRGILFSVWVYF